MYQPLLRGNGQCFILCLTHAHINCYLQLLVLLLGNKIPEFTTASSPVIGGKNTGWSKEGLQRFNALCQAEAKDREENSSVDFEFLVKKQHENNARHKTKKTVVSATVKTYMDEHALCHQI